MTLQRVSSIPAMRLNDSESIARIERQRLDQARNPPALGPENRPPHPLNVTPQELGDENRRNLIALSRLSPALHALDLAVHPMGSREPIATGAFAAPREMEGREIDATAASVRFQGRMPPQVPQPVADAFGAEIARLYSKISREGEPGQNAQYISALANVPRKLAVTVAYDDGRHSFDFSCGDDKLMPTLQSTMKVFDYALAVNDNGLPHVKEHVGVGSTARYPFNAPVTVANVSDAKAVANATNARYPLIATDFIDALKQGSGSEERHRGLAALNAMYNIGAIQTVGMVSSQVALANGSVLEMGEEGRMFNFMSLMKALAQRAGQPAAPVVLDAYVYASELRDSGGNLAFSLAAAEHLYPNMGNDAKRLKAGEIFRAYIADCAIAMKPADLGRALATLRNGGYNSDTGVQVISREAAAAAFEQMRAAGFYEETARLKTVLDGEGKSGVSGQTLLTTRDGLAFSVFWPGLNASGNSTKALEMFGPLQASQPYANLVAALKSA